jgi:hypothetical protein
MCSMSASAKGTVVARAILGDGAMLGRIGNQNVAVRLDAAKPAFDGARCAGRTDHPRNERIVAAGVQDDELELAGTGGFVQDAPKVDRFVPYVRVALEARVDRDDVGGAAHLEAVAGEIDDPQSACAAASPKVRKASTISI